MNIIMKLTCKVIYSEDDITKRKLAEDTLDWSNALSLLKRAFDFLYIIIYYYTQHPKRQFECLFANEINFIIGSKYRATMHSSLELNLKWNQPLFHPGKWKLPTNMTQTAESLYSCT